MFEADAPPLPPVPPGKDDCCRSGCDPCVFDLYSEALQRYEADLQAWQAARKKMQAAKKSVKKHQDESEPSSPE